MHYHLIEIVWGAGLPRVVLNEVPSARARGNLSADIALTRLRNKSAIPWLGLMRRIRINKEQMDGPPTSPSVSEFRRSSSR